MSATCRPPIHLTRALEHPERVFELLAATAPHFPVQRYFRSGAEMRAQSGPADGFIAPNFRADWATTEGCVPGVEPILENPVFCEAAAQLFDSDRVRPWGVYSNITWQLPFDQGGGHTDVPAFLGIDRTRFPTWFLSVMGHSRLFESERVEIATAVAWFYRGRDGGFCYWPEGPDRPPALHEGDIFNTAIVGDNDRMYHRVRPVGARSDGMLGDMGLETRLDRDAGGWSVRDGDQVRAVVAEAELRVSVSWKAYVYRDAGQESQHVAGGGDGLDLEAVLARFAADLGSRGIPSAEPDDPLHDEAFVRLLTDTYVESPTVFDV